MTFKVWGKFHVVWAQLIFDTTSQYFACICSGFQQMKINANSGLRKSDVLMRVAEHGSQADMQLSVLHTSMMMISACSGHGNL